MTWSSHSPQSKSIFCRTSWYRLKMSMPSSPTRKLDPSYSSKPYPPTSIHSLSNPDTNNHFHLPPRQSFHSWPPRAHSFKRSHCGKNATAVYSSLPLEVPEEVVGGLPARFPFSEPHSDSFAPSTSVGPSSFSRSFQFSSNLPNVVSSLPQTVSLQPDVAASSAEGPSCSLGETFFDNVAAVSCVGDTLPVSLTYQRNPLHPGKSFNRSNIPSSPLSSGSGSGIPSSSRAKSSYGFFMKRDQAMFQMTNQHNQHEHQHVLDASAQHYAPNNHGTSHLQYMPNQSPQNHSGNMPPFIPGGQNSSNIETMRNAALPYDVGRANMLPVQNSGVMGSETPPDHFQNLHHHPEHHQQQQSKISQEIFQKRQAERAARNRESSRRAREKAKHRFRTLEMDNFNLRETVRTLRMQNEYLQAQFERLASIQQGCHICRYKTVVVSPPLPPNDSSQPGTHVMHP